MIDRGAGAALREAARTAKRRAFEAARLLSSSRIVALRYDGALGGEADAGPFSILYVGNEAWAREIELYYRPRAEAAWATSRAAAPAVLFRGSLVAFARQRARLEREAADVDLLACEAFPGAPAHEDDFVHCPILTATLRVAPTMAQQIRRMRSRGQRRHVRDVLRRREWVARFETGLAAFETFRTTMYEPYVRTRFGGWGKMDDAAGLRAAYEHKKGGVLLLAPRDRPGEPFGGAILLDEGGGLLNYHRNGFVAAEARTNDEMADHTAAVEIAMLEHAIAQRYAAVDLGYTRNFLDDGLLTHKRRLGCRFVPAAYAPDLRLRVRAGRRAETFARFPILAGGRGDFAAVFGYDERAPRLTKRAWRGTLKGYALSVGDARDPRPDEVRHAVVWTKSTGSDGEKAFREAAEAALCLPDGIEYRVDG